MVAVDDCAVVAGAVLDSREVRRKYVIVDGRGKARGRRKGREAMVRGKQVLRVTSVSRALSLLEKIGV